MENSQVSFMNRDGCDNCRVPLLNGLQDLPGKKWGTAVRLFPGLEFVRVKLNSHNDIEMPFQRDHAFLEFGCLLSGHIRGCSHLCNGEKQHFGGEAGQTWFSHCPKAHGTIEYFYGMGIASVAAMASSTKVIQAYMLHRRKAFIACAIINAVAVAVFIPVSLQKNLFCMLYIAVALLNTAITLSSVVNSTLVMDFSRKGFGSSDYALQMTGIHIGGMAMAAASGFIVERTGYPAFFTMQAVIGIALVVLTCFLFRGRWIPSPTQPQL